MSNIKFNGESFESRGIIVEKIPPIIKAKQRYKQYTIPGRDGILWIDEKTYEPFTLPLECHFNEDVADLDVINKIFNNSGRLTIDGVRYYDAIINNIIEYEKVQYFRKFIISFLCNPIAHDITETTFTYNISGDPSQSMEYDGNAKTWPIIEINGTGQIIVSFSYGTNSSIGFTLNANGNGEYKIDCEAKEITQNNVNKSADMNGEFPYILGDGVSIYVSGTGTLSSLKVKYHNAWL